MNCNIEKLKIDIENMEKACRTNAGQTYTNGTILLARTKFEPRTISTTVEKIEIISDLVKAEELCKCMMDCFVINCFDTIDSCDFTNKFVFSQTEVKSGDTVYAVTINDGDPYGTFVMGVFTEKPNDEEIIKKYNEYLNTLNNEDDEPYEYYIDNVFTLTVE